MRPKKEAKDDTVVFALFYNHTKKIKNTIPIEKAFILRQKISFIRDNQNDNGLSVRQLADKYGVSKGICHQYFPLACGILV